MGRPKFAVKMQFFKVMMPGFHQKLGLPKRISDEIKGQKSQRATLQSRLGTWKISMCRSSSEDNDEDDLIYLNKGWPEFVDLHALTIGDFLVFHHTADLHFNVSVFDKSACEREYLEEKKKNEAVQAVNLDEKSSIEEQSPCFEKKMMPCFATIWARVSIPVEFVRQNSLERHTSLELRDPRGRQWPVKLTTQARMGGGWYDFYVSNGLKDGDTCVFELKRRLLTPSTIFFDVKIESAHL